MYYNEFELSDFIQSDGVEIFDDTIYDNMKRCACCYEYKEYENFYYRKDTNKYGSYCKSCKSLMHKKYYKKHTEHIKNNFKKYYSKNKKKHKQTCKTWVERNPECPIYSSQKQYAKERGIEFELDRDDYKKLVKEKKCWASGKKVRKRKKLAKADSKFISRIDMKGGYNKNNMEVTNREYFMDKLHDYMYDLREDSEI